MTKQDNTYVNLESERRSVIDPLTGDNYCSRTPVFGYQPRTRVETRVPILTLLRNLWAGHPKKQEEAKPIKLPEWEDLVMEEVRKHSNFPLEFKDNAITHKFCVSRVEPFRYATKPPIGDYNLSVDIYRFDSSGEVEALKEIDLGAHFRSSPRRLIPFGQKYFDATKKDFWEIVRSQWQKRIDMFDAEREKRLHG